MNSPSNYEIVSATPKPVITPTEQPFERSAAVPLERADRSSRAKRNRLARFRAQLERVRARINSVDELVQETTVELQSIWTAIAIWSLSGTVRENSLDFPSQESATSEKAAKLELTPRCLLDPLGDTAAWNSSRDQIEALIAKNQAGQPIVEHQPSHFLILVPFLIGSETNWLGGIFQKTPGNSVIAEAMLIADHLKLGIEQFKNEVLQRQSKSLTHVISIGDALAKTDSIEAACITLTNRMRQLSESLQVVMAIKSEKQATYSVASISDIESFDADSDATRKILKAATLANEKEPIHVWHADIDDESLDRLALKNFAHMHSCDAAINIAMLDAQNRPFATLLFAVNKKQAVDANYVAFLQSICQRLASQVHLVKQAQRKPSRIFRDWLVAQRKRRWFRIGAAATGIAMLAMLIPMPYKINCDCETQPVVRRFVAAPYDGLLEESIVHSGDMVIEGQVLAKMEGRRLRMELAALEAEYNGQKKKRDSAMARSSVAESQIAAKEMQRLSSEIGLISGQLENLEIRSPLTGMIISGDLDKAQGAPLELGQELFEVAPLQRMLIELAIPENEIKFIKKGYPVTVRLNAFPFRNFKGTLQRIHAQAEILDDANVFLAEVELPNQAMQLRPGMKGTATISSSMHPLGWNLFHHSWDSLRRWTMW